MSLSVENDINSIFQLLTNSQNHEIIEDMTPAEGEYIICVLQESNIPVSTTVLELAQRILQKNQEVSIHNISVEYVNRSGCQYMTMLGIDKKEQLEIVEHTLGTLRYDLSCSILHKIAEIRIFNQNSSFPSVEEIETFINNEHQLRTNPSEYCENKKHLVPARGLKYLKTSYLQKMDSHKSCSICQETIQPKSKVYILPQCKHIFHGCEEECLGEGCGIKTWLLKCRKCPNCNSEVSIDKPNAMKRKIAELD